MGYDPNAHEPTRGQTEFDEREIPAGVYMMGPAWLKCPSERSWKARFDVLMGPFKGASAFVLQGRDTNKTGTKNRLFYYSKSAGLTGALETTDGGTITERSLRADVLGHAIKAKVTRKKTSRQGNDGAMREFIDYDFQMFQAREEWSQAELDIAAKWEAEFAEKRQNDTGYGGGGDWGGSGGSSSGGGSQGSADPMGGGYDGPPPDGDGWGGSDGWS